MTLYTRHRPLPDLLRELERQTAYTFVYSTSQLGKVLPPEAELENLPLDQVLRHLLLPLGLEFQVSGQQIILRRRPAAVGATLPAPPPGPAPRRPNPTPFRGRVLDAATGQPLPGASVVVRNDTRGTATAANGTFSLPLTPADSVLVVSSLGFAPQEIRPAGRPTLDIQLREGLRALAEVLVTGPGPGRDQKSVAYAVQVLPAAQVVEAREVNFINSLSGKLAGVDIVRNGSGPMGSTNIIIRGYTSLSRDSRPLVVVDGVPIDNQSPLQATRFGGYDLGDGLSAINPEDIENLTVLKGGNAAALYGNRAANGALIVTTKKGRRGLGLHLSSNTTFDQAQVLTDYQNDYGQGSQGRFLVDANGDLSRTPEGYPIIAPAGTSIGSWGPRMEGQLARHWTGEIKPFVAQPGNPAGFFRTGFTTANTVVLTTGSDRGTLRVSATDLHNRGTYPNSHLHRDYLTLRAIRNLGNRLSADLKAGYVYSDNFNRPTLGANPDNVMGQFSRLPRSVDLADLHPYRDPVTRQPVLWNQSRLQPFQPTPRQNPYWAAYLNTNRTHQHRLNGSVALRYDFTDWLWLQLRAGTDRYQTRFRYQYASYTSWNSTAQPDRGGYAESELTMREDNIDFVLNGRRRLSSEWELTAQAFGNLLQKRSATTGTTGLGLRVPNVFQLDNVAAATAVRAFSQFEVQSLFARAQLTYHDAVFLELTGRNDWDSTLPAGDWSYFYPSASLAVAYTDLLPWQSELLTLGKLRASWALVGKGTGPYELTTRYDLTTSGVPEAPGVGSSYLGQPFASLQNQLAPRQLRPQLTRAVELGSEMRFGAGRALLDVAVYRTNTYNQVVSVLTAPSSGFQTQLINAGNIRNQGLEITATVVPVRTARGLNWELSLNWATNQSRVLRLADANDRYQLGLESNNVAIVAQAGRPFGEIYGTRLQRAPTGQLLLGPDGLPLAPAGPTVPLGNFQPRWFGGVQNQFRYRQLRLSALVDGRWGGQIYSVSQQQAAQFGNSHVTLAGRAGWYASEEARRAAGQLPGAWTPTGGLLVEGVVKNPDGTFSPSRRYVNPEQYWSRLATISEPFVYDASFLKLREVKLTWQLPAAWVARVAHLKSASVAAVARNLAFLSRATVGFDPESAYNLGQAQGLESGAFPQSRSWGYHLQLDF
ncbi:SusC/RagA family TonB-linked outer membrane protein [Hymenobacter sp. NST-14]|uniref:SusC/RagA family TonB-linked outer membrane protein n=1 Tax=Hymenobacter piscis TaxID=2839984 RepID=UPI001C01BD58|nr:SusC/RagA family TonB-linked outer membrane protein [Hymenobacter piscis]MBT9392278.1 SusC/RagA family TonB-linked outer membrane protein [Hymenobacter piscis]